MDAEGHIIHIDFEFILSNSPGSLVKMENAPFKLTAEYVELLEFENSNGLNQLKHLFVEQLIAMRKHHTQFEQLLFALGKGKRCFLYYLAIRK